MNWSGRPFVRILFFYVSGIFLARYLDSFVGFNFGWFLTFAVILLFSAFLLVRFNLPWKLRYLRGIFSGILIVGLGFWSTQQKLDLPKIRLTEKASIYTAEVVKDPVLSEKSAKTVFKIFPFREVDSGFRKPVRVMAFFARNEKSEKLRFGDKVVFNAKLANPEPPKNPYEFDYAQFLRFNEINYTVFLAGQSWKLLENGDSFSLKLIASDLRNYILNAFQENGLEGKDYAVAAAMILGYDDLMEPELEQNYIQAGAMHILCVSGLHVGVIYFVLSFLLTFLKRNRFQKILKAVILLLGVWFYALLTGLSPSVQRASVMLTVFIVGNLFQRDRESLNTLAAAAMLMLIYDPLLIFNVGFQLSYSAVLGILLFHQPIYRLIYFKSWLLDKMWSLTVVSFAAQLGTFPLAAHYFHFFPTYFWLTNLFVLPLSFLIIGTGFFFVGVSWIPFVSGVVGMFLTWFVKGLNLVIGVVEYLPFNGIRNIYFPWIKVLLIYMLVGLIYQVLTQKKIRLIIPTLGIILVLVSFIFYRNYAILNQKKMVVYQIYNHSAIGFIDGDKQICLVDNTLITEPQKADFQLSNSAISWGVKRVMIQIDSAYSAQEEGFYTKNGFGYFGNYRFAVIADKQYFPTDRGNKIRVNGLLIRGRKYLDLAELQKSIDFDFVVMDGSVPNYKQKTLFIAADTLGLKCYSTSKSGAYVMNF